MQHGKAPCTTPVCTSMAITGRQQATDDRVEDKDISAQSSLQDQSTAAAAVSNGSDAAHSGIDMQRSTESIMQPKSDANQDNETEGLRAEEQAIDVTQQATGATQKADGHDIEVTKLLESLTTLTLDASSAEAKGQASASEPVLGPPLTSFDIQGIAHLIQSGRAKNIVCMCGAGISVSAGIPDFRTPGTGLYSQLAKYKLPRPEAVFSLDFFRRNTEPFHQLAKELFPGCFKPTATHYFMTLLHKKGLLLRCFTQNIDSLETLAGLPKQKLVAAHGNFDSASCIDCGEDHSVDAVKTNIWNGKVTRCKSCEGLVKPDIVFFGESLPQAFDVRRRKDFPKCDLLIVMGTSLVVYPFAGLLHEVGSTTPRLLINKEVVGVASELDALMFRKSPGFQFLDPEANTRDALFLGDCDQGVRQLCQLLGWHDELQELIDNGHSQLDDMMKDTAA